MIYPRSKRESEGFWDVAEDTRRASARTRISPTRQDISKMGTLLSLKGGDNSNGQE
jgi:hypothetical protein